MANRRQAQQHCNTSQTCAKQASMKIVSNRGRWNRIRCLPATFVALAVSAWV
jgi:hypothetical protein